MGFFYAHQNILTDNKISRWDSVTRSAQHTNPISRKHLISGTLCFEFESQVMTMQKTKTTIVHRRRWIEFCRQSNSRYRTNIFLLHFVHSVPFNSIVLSEVHLNVLQIWNEIDLVALFIQHNDLNAMSSCRMCRVLFLCSKQFILLPTHFVEEQMNDSVDFFSHVWNPLFSFQFSTKTHRKIWKLISSKKCFLFFYFYATSQHHIDDFDFSPPNVFTIFPNKLHCSAFGRFSFSFSSSQLFLVLSRDS